MFLMGSHMAGKLYGERFMVLMIPKAQLVAGEYYIGRCRNASVARWDGEKFHHWRRKFGSDFIETIKHPEDDDTFDCFVPVDRSNGHDVRPIDFAPEV